ncbi:F-box/LRR-repeat protein FipoQ [Cotesia typhae]|uniref:F-box/LRR-repeat protein FipoQ n=1 Tax=Cotesia typhae TaxID=2053667 RepID=UPI003D686AF5
MDLRRMSNWNVLNVEAALQQLNYQEKENDGFVIIVPRSTTTIEKLPDKVILNIFEYLSHREICRLARVCKRWRQIAYDTRLWKHVSLRPEISGLHVNSLEMLLQLIRILVMGTQERLGVNIHVDQLMDGIANNCPNLERLELRWDPENLRFSDKSQKAIDVLRVKCIKLKCLVLSDGRYYEVVKANFERADRTTVVRTTTCSRVTNYYLLQNYKDLIFN